jgi:hypothetical protein
MECKDYREQFHLLLNNDLGGAQKAELERHLAGCEDCRKEFESIKKVWMLMGEISQQEPSESMSENFDAMLSGYKKELIMKRNPLSELIDRLAESWAMKARPRLEFSILLVVAGLFIGYILHRPEQSAISFNRQIDSLTSQVSDMKQLMMLSLLQDQSASRRIQAVSYTDDLSSVDRKVTDALFTTLNEDTNVNVRLATLEALFRLSGDPVVREGLVRSIELQDSPIMQSAIADVMVKLHEKNSVGSLKKLLDKKDLNKMVKINIEKSIQQLI